MTDSDKRFQEYDKTKKYKGFYKLREREYKLLGQTKMTFTNGEKEVFATGLFKEIALKKIFDKIDTYVQLNTVDNLEPPLDYFQ